MVTTKVRRIGNSLGVVIPASLLSQLNIGEGQQVTVTVADQALVLRPVSLKTSRLLERSKLLLATHRDAIEGVGHE